MNLRKVCFIMVLMSLLGMTGSVFGSSPTPSGSSVAKKQQKLKREEVSMKYPIINPDNSVTFSYVDSLAKKVFLKGSFIHKKKVLGLFNKDGKYQMSKDGNVWTYTTEPLESELYTYNFEVDKKKIIDPMNPEIMRDVEDSLSFFIIKGGIGDDYSIQKVGHGKVKKVWYPTVLDNLDERRMTIYFPSEYFVKKNKKRRYPVLYLLHGSGGDENAWSDDGRAIEILDNLIAQHRCKPMIVVMPNGNVNLAAAPGDDPKNPDVQPTGKNMSSMFGKIEAVFMEDVVKFVDRNYRTVPSKSHRAIAGVSLGGMQTLFISLNNPDDFDYVGLFSAQTTNGLGDGSIHAIQKIGNAFINFWHDNKDIQEDDEDEKEFKEWASEDLVIYENIDEKLKIQFSTPPQLYYIACGEDDFIIKMNNIFRKQLEENNCQYVYNQTDGGHSWENWRKYLLDFLPRIFK